MQRLQQIRIVLLEPSHPGNIGAVARSMKTMGLTRLVLVNPKMYPHPEASRRAAGAANVLQNAQIANNLSSVLADCTIVLGSSVREREVSWPTINPRQAAEQLIDHLADASQQAAILFGRESSGLRNDEMDQCDSQICIPANRQYNSLNLASAVQIIAYELRMLSIQNATQLNADANRETPALRRQKSATAAQREAHIDHLQKTLEQIDFIKSKPPTMLMRKLIRLYNKARLSVEEIQILRGILTAIQARNSESPE